MRGITVFAALFTASLTASGAQAGMSDDLKAAYLVNLVKFVEWPTASLSDTLNICFLKPSTVKDRLEDGIARKQRWAQVEGRHLAVHLLDAPAASVGCQILYLDARTADALWNTFPVPDALLTISDQRDFAHHGGIIQFQMDRDNIRLAINTTKLGRSGLVISAALGSLVDRIESERTRSLGRW